MVESQLAKLQDKNFSGPWTLFWDMHSGGSTKFHDFEKIYVQGTEKEATDLFERVTGMNPYQIGCYCCGENYSASEHPDLVQASAYHRGCQFDEKLACYVEVPNTYFSGRKASYKTIEQYIEDDEVLLIFSDGTMDKGVNDDE